MMLGMNSRTENHLGVDDDAAGRLREAPQAGEEARTEWRGHGRTRAEGKTGAGCTGA